MPLPSEKGEGLMARWKCANSQPETLASSAGDQEDLDLVAKVETPIARPSRCRRAVRADARPGRESSRRSTPAAAMSATAQISRQ